MRTFAKKVRRGFTLIETVVTVGIVAAMAAVVIPQVAKQFDAADPTRIQNDLKNIQTAIETFNVNVRVLPADIDDLANKPGLVANADSTITTATTQPVMTTTEAGLWNGPYIDVALVDAQSAEQLVVTGFSATIADSFVCYDSGNNETGISEGSSATTGANEQTCANAASGTQFLALQIFGVTCTDVAGSTFMQINALFDGTSEGTNAETLGRIRCRAAGTAGRTTNVTVVYFLAVSLS